MSRRINNLDPNLRIKILAVVFAFGIWYLINSFSDPAIRMTINNVSVDILNGDVIEKKGDVYTVLDNTDVIPVVTILAKRSVIDKLESKNIIATADVRDIEQDGSVRIVLTTDKYSSSIERITGSITHVELRVEPRKTRSLSLEVETQGSPADGYMLYDTTAEQNQVILSGPQSYVNEVGRAAVSVDITGTEKSIKSYPEVILYDEDNNVISSEEMERHKLHLNSSSVKVVATVYQTKAIPITFGSEVPIAYGYELVSEPAVEPSSVSVVGAAGILQDFESIEIPVADVAPDYINSTMYKILKVKDYLPEGVYLTDDADDSVTVYIRVREIPQEEESKTGDTSGGEADSSGTSGEADSSSTSGEADSSGTT